MQYVKNVLRVIADDQPLSKYEDNDALMAVFQGYNEKAMLKDGLSPLSLETKGAEFKEQFSKLDTVDKINLLHLYTKDLDPKLVAPEDIETREKRKLKTWLIKASFYVFAPIPPLIVGAAIVLGVKSGGLPDNAAFNSVITLAGEVLKLIIGGAL